MIEVLQKLAARFHEDHAVLGRGFYDLSTCLRSNDLTGAKDVAEALDQSAGAHIVFEEEVLYPTLRRLLSDGEADRFETEHGMGLRAIRAVLELDPEEPLADGHVRDILGDSEVMERHIAQCGDMFGALGRIPESEARQMLTRLEELRALAPRWTEYAESRGE